MLLLSHVRAYGRAIGGHVVVVSLVEVVLRPFWPFR